MSSSRFRLCAAVTLALLSTAIRGQAALRGQHDAVQVFVLAGQSNMEGKAQNVLLEHQAEAPATKDFFAPFRKDGQWIVRDDVFVKFLARHGKLTIGYGSPNRTGAELAFGCAMGDHFASPVLLIKTAWGGHSLRKDFRPPAAGLPDEAVLARELEKRTAQVEKRNEKEKRHDALPTMADLRAEYGVSYRNMLAEVRDTLANCDTLFPALAGRPKHLAGFVWFQGWNDQYDGAELEYETNLRHLITSVRKDLDAAKLPVVIGVMGQNGSAEAKGAMRTIQGAQLAMNDIAEFHGTVRAVRTDELVDTAAEKLFPEWKARTEEWQRTGSDHPYHYLGSAIWFTRIGQAFAAAMLDMIE